MIGDVIIRCNFQSMSAEKIFPEVHPEHVEEEPERGSKIMIMICRGTDSLHGAYSSQQGETEFLWGSYCDFCFLESLQGRMKRPTRRIV